MAELPPTLEDETVEELGPYLFIQKKTGHRLTVDSVLLADFLPPLKDTDSVIDIGAGTGAIPLLLSFKTPVRTIVAVEVDKAAADAARRNAEANGLGSRIKVLESDFRDLKAVYPQEGAFSVVVTNPPYIKAGSGRLSPHKGRDAARSEMFGGLTDLIGISRHLAGKKGRFYAVYPVLRLIEMLRELRKTGLSVGRLRFVHTSPKKAARLFLIEAGEGLKLTIEDPAFL